MHKDRNKPRVLHIIETLGIGGAEQVLVNLLPAIAAKGIHTEAAVLWPPYTLAERIEQQGITVHRLNLQQRWNVWRGLSELKRIAVENRITTFHAHLFFPMLHTAVSRWVLKDVRRVLTFHNESFIGFPANTAWKKLRRLGEAWLTARCFNSLTAVSDAVGDHYAEQLGIDRERIQYVPNGFPVDRIVRDPKLDTGFVRVRYGVPEGGFLVVSPARLIEQKGHKFLLEAVAILRQQAITPYVRIVGNGALRETLEQTVRSLHLAEQVQILPALPHSELFPLVQSADLVVLPSVFEGFGLMQCECMLLELPVIGTQVGGFLTTIVDSESGVLVPPSDSQALATAMARLINDPGRRREMGFAARRRIVKMFSIENVASAYVDLYRTLQ